MSSQPSGWAEITHPFHPRRGQRFAVLKARCVAGVDTLILRDTACGTFAVARDWTDLAAPRRATQLCGSVGRLDLHSLCELVELIEVWTGTSRGGLVK